MKNLLFKLIALNSLILLICGYSRVENEKDVLKQDFTAFFILISVFIVCWKFGISNRINEINLLYGYQKLLNKKLIILSITYFLAY